MTRSLIENHPLFQSLSTTEIDQIEPLLNVNQYSDSDVIIGEGDASHCMYFLLSGAVRMVKDINGESSHISSADDVRFFGEMGLVFNRPRSVSVIAVGDVTVAELSKDNFQVVKGFLPQIVQEVENIAQARFARFKEYLLGLSTDGELTPEQVSEFRSVFNDIDDDGNGEIDEQEFQTFLTRLLQREPSPYEVEVLWEKIDEDKSGAIDFDEFCGSIQHFLWILNLAPKE
eukprot:TRINITY_DN3129_c0_g2_i1.p1 TRINITY_DN3129_c0_g2~~TRINITY_DN3129_c0_g2_i1.p1  ORF type:complete len:230 (+),score=60.40 TRINITY_DN3129_c0_g2_i1:11-700(+)